jgi:hypothetical protein
MLTERDAYNDNGERSRNLQNPVIWRFKQGDDVKALALSMFTQYNATCSGFLFLLSYVTLNISDHASNIYSSVNPSLWG